MRTSSKSIITASLVLPLLLVACDRPQQPPTGAAPSQEKQAMNPAPPSEPMPSSPPAPADVSKNPAAPSSPAPSTMPPVDQKSEPK